MPAGGQHLGRMQVDGWWRGKDDKRRQGGEEGCDEITGLVIPQVFAQNNFSQDWTGKGKVKIELHSWRNLIPDPVWIFFYFFFIAHSMQRLKKFLILNDIPTNTDILYYLDWWQIPSFYINTPPPKKKRMIGHWCVTSRGLFDGTTIHAKAYLSIMISNFY